MDRPGTDGPSPDNGAGYGAPPGPGYPPPPAPSAHIPTPDAIPVPPRPTPVTRFGSSGTGGLFIGLAVLAFVAIVFASAYLLVVTAFQTGPRQRVASVLDDRVAKEYPGFTATYDQSLRRNGEPPVVNAYFTLRSDEVKGFTLRIVYSAPEDKRDDPAAYDNAERFFHAKYGVYNPKTSFMREWVKRYPGVPCLDVVEAPGSSVTTKAYDVLYYGTTDKLTGKIEVLSRSMLYSKEAETWSVIESPGGADAGDGSDDAAAGADVPVDVSDMTTEAVVADFLPTFRVAGAAQEANGTWVAVLRSKDRPKVFLAIDTDYISATDGVVSLLGKRGSKASSFVKMWEHKHPGAMITSLEIDPDYTGDTNRVDVAYSLSRRWANLDRFEVYQYKPATKTWKLVERY